MWAVTAMGHSLVACAEGAPHLCVQPAAECCGYVISVGVARACAAVVSNHQRLAFYRIPSNQWSNRIPSFRRESVGRTQRENT